MEKKYWENFTPHSMIPLRNGLAPFPVVDAS